MEYCCEMLESHLTRECDIHDQWECPDVVLIKKDNGEIVMPIRDGGSSFYSVYNCPWCGIRFDDGKVDRVVIFNGIGGFQLTNEALIALYDRKSPFIEVNPYGESATRNRHFNLTIELGDGNHIATNSYRNVPMLRYDPDPRRCPLLLGLIDEWGVNRVGEDLKVVKVPSTAEWLLREDETGCEWLAERHRTWGVY